MESTYERNIATKLAVRGWFNVKLSKTNRNGIPDRLFLKDGKVFFIEFKSNKGVLSEIQKYRIGQLREKGFHCFIFKEPKK
jgi:Holliday junction resolvase